MIKYTVSELRNPIKILNHKDRIKEKIEITTMFEKVDCEKEAVENIIEQVAKATSVSTEHITKLLVACAGNTNLEIHLTDKCNLNCSYCSFKKKKGELCLEQVDKAIRIFKPRAITFSGGGENTLHPNFSEVIIHIHENYPDVQMGLVTNGVILKPGKYLDFLSWIRCSLDATSEEEMNTQKGRTVYSDVIKNIEYYLNETNIQNVGVGYLFSQYNINSVPCFLEEMYKLETLSCRKKVLNLQFRPLRPEYSKFFEVINGHDETFNLIEMGQIDRILEYVKYIKDNNYRKFVEKQTNISIFNKNKLNKYWMPCQEFSRCYMCSVYTLLRANGDLFSCIHLGEIEECALANIDKIDEKNVMDLASIGLKRIKYMNKKGMWCNEKECRYAHINNIVENNLESTKKLPIKLQENKFF